MKDPSTPADASPDATANVGEDNIWAQQFRAPGKAPEAALFLDRDGVVVDEVNYLHRPDDVRLAAGAAALIERANRNGIPVIVVTNQAGIARGYYAWAEFAAVQARIIEDLGREGAHVDAVYACPFYNEGNPPYRHPDHPCRKPNAGMLVRAAADLGLDLSRSWIVGDRASDIAAGQSAGLLGGVHLACGHGARPDERAQALALATPAFSVIGCKTLTEALNNVPGLAGK